MAKGSLLAHKKGASLMVSYVLLVVIAVSLATLVYTFLKTYVPKSETECPEQLSLQIKSAVCYSDGADTLVNITFSNTGLFNISWIFLRFGQKDQSILQQVNKGKEAIPPMSPDSSDVIYTKLNITDYLPSDPQEKTNLVIEAQPAYVSNRKVSLCQSIARYPLSCP